MRWNQCNPADRYNYNGSTTSNSTIRFMRLARSFIHYAVDCLSYTWLRPSPACDRRLHAMSVLLPWFLNPGFMTRRSSAAAAAAKQCPSLILTALQAACGTLRLGVFAPTDPSAVDDDDQICVPNETRRTTLRDLLWHDIHWRSCAAVRRILRLGRDLVRSIEMIFVSTLYSNLEPLMSVAPDGRGAWLLGFERSWYPYLDSATFSTVT